MRYGRHARGRLTPGSFIPDQAIHLFTSRTVSELQQALKSRGYLSLGDSEPAAAEGCGWDHRFLGTSPRLAHGGVKSGDAHPLLQIVAYHYLPPHLRRCSFVG